MTHMTLGSLQKSSLAEGRLQHSPGERGAIAQVYSLPFARQLWPAFLDTHNGVAKAWGRRGK